MKKPERIDPSAIISAIRSGEPAALDDIYAAYRDEFFRWAGKRFQATRQDFEDAWQEAVVAFFESVRKGHLTGFEYSLRTWLFTVGYRRLTNSKRKTKWLFWRDTFEDALLKDEQLPDFQWDEPSVDEWALVEKAMRSISPQCREILVKRFYEGKKIPEIKAALGLNSENTTSATLSRCLKKLKETVLAMMNEDER